MKIKSKGNQFQPFHFNDIDEFFEHVTPEEKKLVQNLRNLIFQCLPDCKEKLAYNVPFYYLNKRICYIWPGSVPWGKTITNGVQLGFCDGYLLSDELNYLDKRGRKQVFTKTYLSVREIEVDADIIKTLLFESADIDKENVKGKQKKYAP
jgi:hypothetical protein